MVFNTKSSQETLLVCSVYILNSEFISSCKKVFLVILYFMKNMYSLFLSKRSFCDHRSTVIQYEEGPCIVLSGSSMSLGVFLYRVVNV